MILCAVFISSDAIGATFEVISDVQSKKPVVIVGGEIQYGDEKEFVKKTLNLDEAVVVFHSPGGNVVAAIEIGKAIRLKEFYTYVPKDMLCASACAISWLGGTKRFMSKDARIGFHAAYKLRDGQAAESGLANALIGGYLNSIGLPQRTIAYVTSADPNSMQWINYEEATKYGIDVTLAEVQTKDLISDKDVNGGSGVRTEIPKKNITTSEPMPKEVPSNKIEKKEDAGSKVKVHIDPLKDRSFSAEELLQLVMRCEVNNEFKPEEVIKFLQQKDTIGKNPIEYGDGVPVYKVIKPIKIFGMDIVTLEGWNDTGGIFIRVPGTPPPKYIGVGFHSMYGDSIEDKLPKDILSQKRRMEDPHIYAVKANEYSIHEKDGSYTKKRSPASLNCSL